MIYKVITGRLLQHEAFDNLVKDRLFPVIIPQTRSFPAVSYNTIVATPDLTKDTTLQDTLTFQVSIFSKVMQKFMMCMKLLETGYTDLKGL